MKQNNVLYGAYVPTSHDAELMTDNSNGSMSAQCVIEGVVPPPAPTRTTEMVKAAATAYIERHSLNHWGEVADVARDISKAWHVGMDGYELAKELERNFYWGSLSLQDAEDLDGIGWAVRDAEEEARKAWVLAWDIKPPYPVGTEITRGVIASVHEYSAATYNVKENGCTQDGRFLLVKFENAKATGGAQ